jgi:hypothetical protein
MFNSACSNRSYKTKKTSLVLVVVVVVVVVVVLSVSCKGMQSQVL